MMSLLVWGILLGNLFVLIFVLRTLSTANTLILLSKLILQSLFRKGFLLMGFGRLWNMRIFLLSRQGEVLLAMA
ncbi:hypothetical protein LINGRAHAP2_LOCUS34709 [Linum grandiflorum]